MMMNFKDKLYSYFSVGIIIACCCTFIIGWIPIFDRTWIWALALVLLSLLFYKEGLIKNYIFPLLFYGFILYLNAYLGDPKFDWVSSTMELFSFFIASFVFYIFSQKSFERVVHIFLFLYSAVIIVTFIGTAFIYKQEPEILRMIQERVNEGDISLASFYARYGVESYQMGHALPCLIPVTIYVMKETTNLLIRIISAIFLCIIILLIYMSTATTSFLISIILGLISFLFSENRIRNIGVIILGTCLTFYIINSHELLGFLLENVNFESGSTYAGKVDDFRDYATYGEAGSQTGGRLGLYKRSLDVFYAYPILGSDDLTSIGSHSIFIDRLAMIGLLGVIPLFLFLYKYIQYVLSLLYGNTRIYCLLGFISFFTMGFLKNILSFEYIMITLFIMPLFCLYIDKLFFPENDTDTDDDF